MPITLVIADDHPLVIAGLESILKNEQDFEVLASCNNGLTALQAVQLHQPDIIVLDLVMPDMSGLEVVRDIRFRQLPTKVVLITATLDDDLLVEAVMQGVQGIILKEMAPQMMVQCIKKVYAGEQWIERRAAKLALERMMRRESGSRDAATFLTPRETELAQLVAQGHRNRDIAEKLFISEGTVKVHLHNIYEKLKVKGRMELLKYAQDKGLI